MKENIFTGKDNADNRVRKVFAWHQRKGQTKNTSKTAPQDDKHLKLFISVAQS